jgi:hypothetical protein
VYAQIRAGIRAGTKGYFQAYTKDDGDDYDATCCVVRQYVKGEVKKNGKVDQEWGSWLDKGGKMVKIQKESYAEEAVSFQFPARGWLQYTDEPQIPVTAADSVNGYLVFKVTIWDRCLNKEVHAVERKLIWTTGRTWWEGQEKDKKRKNRR